MSATANAPVSKFHIMELGANRGIGRQEGALDGVGTLVVSFNFRTSLKVVANSPPEGVVGFFTGVEGLEVVEILSNQEISKSEIAQRILTLPNEIAQSIESRPRLLQQVDLEVLIVLIPEKSLDVLHRIVKNAHDVVDIPCILGVLPEEVGLARASNDVLGDGGGLSQFEISVDEVGDVGEVEAQILLILIEPLLPVVVLHLLEGQASVREKKTQVLTEATHFPISED